MRKRFARLCALLTAVGVLGCASTLVVNEPLAQIDMTTGYRPETYARKRASGEVFMSLAFSGGGTRAAALAYGVLRELRDTPVYVGGETRPLLDEVDSISSVSGGSFTAAYYALYGDRIFEDFEERFLRRNIQRQLILQLFRPRTWFRLARRFFSRTELAVEVYDRELFGGAKFGDLRMEEGPLVQINATDLSIGDRFTFVQSQFDLICSDLEQFKIARAVAASSAVPAVFVPMTLRNYAGRCKFEAPKWLDEALSSRDRRRSHVAQSMASYLDADRRRYIHLVDGGISDNLGARGPLDNMLARGGIWQSMQRIGLARPQHVVIVLVNAEIAYDDSFDLSARAPSLTGVLSFVSGVQINRYNFETIELLRRNMQEWALEIPPDEEGRQVEVHLVEVSFDEIADPEERRFFQSVGTNFNLRDETVDRLIDVGGELLRSSESFQQLVRALQPPAARPD